MVLITGCQPDANTSQIDHSQDVTYYQLGNVGSYWEYQTDSLIFDNQGATQLNRTGYIRTEIVDVNGMIDGDTVYTVQLNRRADLADSWREDKRYQIEKTLGGDIIVNIDNLVFKEFSFPFREDDDQTTEMNEASKWQSILFSDPEEIIEFVEGEDLQTYIKWDSTFVINRDTTLMFNNTTYENVATLQEATVDNFIDLRKSFAYYAGGIGLILRERSILHTQCQNIDPDCISDPWEEKAYKGYITTQKLLDYSIL